MCDLFLPPDIKGLKDCKFFIVKKKRNLCKHLIEGFDIKDILWVEFTLITLRKNKVFH